MGEIDHECTDKPVCPYCGHTHRDAWEWPDNSEDSECEECERTFHAYRTIYVTWETRPAEDEGGDDDG